MRRLPLVLGALLALSSPVLARVPLGALVPAQAVAGLTGPQGGPYMLAFYTQGCAEAGSLERHWAVLRASGARVVAVNPVEPGTAAVGPPGGLPALGGDAALELARALKVRAYPTTVLVGGDGRVLDVLEGLVDEARVRASLSLLGDGP